MGKSETFKQGDFVEIDYHGEVAFSEVTGVCNPDRHGEITYLLQTSPGAPLSCAFTAEHLTKLETVEEQVETVEKQRRQSILKIVMQILDINKKTAWAISRIKGENEAPKPGTGVFAVRGFYLGEGFSDLYISAVNADSEMDANDVRELLIKRYPHGFDMIPDQTADSNGSSSMGRLASYSCEQLPSEVLSLIDWELPTVISPENNIEVLVEKVTVFKGREYKSMEDAEEDIMELSRAVDAHFLNTAGAITGSEEQILVAESKFEAGGQLFIIRLFRLGETDKLKLTVVYS